MTELRLAGATNIEEVNSVLRDFLPRFNRRFRVPPHCTGTAFRPLDPGVCLEHILCFKHSRRVAKDNTVRFQLHTLQLLPGPERPSYAGTVVEVLEGLDRRLDVRRYGRIIPTQEAPPSIEVLQEFLPLPPVATGWANTGQRFSNHWDGGRNTRRTQPPPLTGLPPPTSPAPLLRGSRRSFRGRYGRRYRRQGVRGCPT